MAQVTASVLCTAALRKIRAIDPTETPNTTELSNVFAEFKRMVKSWAGRVQGIWASSHDQHTLTAGTKSYSIYSGGDIDTPRPIALKEGCYVNWSGQDWPLKIIGENRYNNISMKDTGNLSVPRLIYYKASYQYGYIYLWPPGGGTLNLYSWKDFAEPATIDNDVVFPDQYQDAIVWNLACRIKPEFLGDPTPYEVMMAEQTWRDLININEANDPAEMTNEMSYLGVGHESYNIDAE